MIGNEILEKAYRLTNKNATTFLDGNITNIYKDLNTAYGHRILDILRVRVDKNANIKNCTTDLISTEGLIAGNNGYNGEYAFPSDLLRPTRVEISYDGETYRKAKIYDNAINQGTEFKTDNINNGFSRNEPMVDFARNSFKIRPLKTTPGNITDGIYIEYEKRQEDFTENTEPAEIEANLQDLLSYDLAEMEILMHTDKYDANKIRVFRDKHAEVEKRFLRFYKQRLGNSKKMTFKYISYK
jgi:hypothetical protein